MVALAEAEFKPVLLSLAQTYQPFLALVFIVTVRGVGLELTAAVVRPPRLSVLPLRAKLKVCDTLALTTIWSSVMLAVEKVALSIVAGPLSWVVTVPPL